MALLFGGATSDQVSIAASASINNIAPATYYGWIYPTTLTALKRVFYKTGTTFQGTDILLNSPNPQFLEFRRYRTGTSDTYVTSSLPLTTNKWWFWACTLDIAATPTGHIYIGDLATPAAEPTYSTATNGTSGLGDDSTGALVLGNATGANAFQGRIARSGMIGAALNLGQVKQLQYATSPMGNTKAKYELGFNGTGTQTDYSGSGNNGTVTGATQISHVPTPSTFGK